MYVHLLRQSRSGDKARRTTNSPAPLLQRERPLFMIQLIRRFLDSRIGVIVAIAFLGLIALAFAGTDVSSNKLFGGVAGGDRVATVGDEKIGTAELQRSVQTALERYRQQNPTVTMQVFVVEGAVGKVLDEMLDRESVAVFASNIGLRAGRRLVDSEIANAPYFRGASGKFDDEIYKQALRQQGLSEKELRDDLAKGLLVKQAAVPVSFGTVMPSSIARRYAGVLSEARKGAIALIPSAAYAPAKGPDEAQLNAFYKETRTRYIRPERRVLQYATFDESALKDLKAPTEAQVAARYKRDAALYAPSEQRSFTQLVLPTEQAAKAVKAELATGKPLDTAARVKGLRTSSTGLVSKSAYAGQTSAALATAMFAAPQGQVSEPLKGTLGYYLVRVDRIEKSPGKTIDQVRGEISTALAAEQKRKAIIDLSAGIEEELDGGAALTDIAKELGLQLHVTPPITADGRVYGKPDSQGHPMLTPALSTAFSMDEGEPQLAEVDPGKLFLIYEVTEITQSAPAPLKEIKEQVNAAWMLAQGAKQARLAADRVLAKVGKGMAIEQALAEEKKPLPRPDRIAMTREELTRFAQGGRRPPPPLVLMFSMSENSVKRLEAPDDNGWMLIQLVDIEPGKVDDNPQVLASVTRELGALQAQEYEAQFIRAARTDVGVTRNDAAIKAVKRQLAGSE